MPSEPGNETAKTSTVWFFVALGLLLFVSTMFPSCHSKQKQWLHGTALPEEKLEHQSSATPAPRPPPTSPTPPARPATPYTPPPPPPHH